MTVTLHYTEAIFRTAIADFLRRSFVQRMLLPTILGILVALASFYSDSIWLKAFVAIPLIAIPLMFALGYWLHLRRSLSRFRLLEDGKVTISVTEKGTVIESAIGKSESAWKIYTDLWEFPNYHLLFYGDSQFITLPRDQVPPEMIDFIRAKLPQKSTA